MYTQALIILTPQQRLQIKSQNQLNKARATNSLRIKVESPKLYNYLDLISTLRINEMAQYIGIERRNAQRQLAAKNGLMAEILLGKVFHNNGINWCKPGKEVIDKYDLKKDLGDYQIDDLIFDLKSSDTYTSICSYKRLDSFCRIDYIIGSHIHIDTSKQEIEMHVYGLKDYATLYTVKECEERWNVKYQLINHYNFTPLEEFKIFDKLKNLGTIIM